MAPSPNVAFLLGAGFSAEFGIPTMVPFLTEFSEYVERELPDLQKTYKKHIERLGVNLDLEGLLTSLEPAAHVSSALPVGLDQVGIEEWEKDSQQIQAFLQRFIVEKCESFNEKAARNSYGPFFAGVAAQLRETGFSVFTTNYDRVIEVSLDAAGVAWSDGFKAQEEPFAGLWAEEFDRRVSLAKLHGSVSWYEERLAETPKYWRLDRGYALPGPDFTLTRAGRELRPLMILPTMEKDALSDPYTYLQLFFGEVLSKCDLLIVAGSSLRDNHISSIIKYRKDSLIVLVIDENPAPLSVLLQGVTVVTIRSRMGVFIESASAVFFEYLGSAKASTNKETLYKLTEDFAEKTNKALIAHVELDPDSSKAIQDLNLPGLSKRLQAISRLRRHSHEHVANALIGKLSDPEEEIRLLAAGVLGESQSTLAVTALADRTKGDVSAPVRLESALALRAIGGAEAEEAIADYESAHPDDAFFGLTER